jgi:hypothetical protein
MNTQEKIITNRLGLLNLATTLGNVSQACKVMGVSRDTFKPIDHTRTKAKSPQTNGICVGAACRRQTFSSHHPRRVLSSCLS